MNLEDIRSTHLDILRNAARSPDSEQPSAVLRTWRRRLGFFSILTALPAVLGWYVSEAKANRTVSTTVPAPVSGETERRQVNTVKSYSKPELLQDQTTFLLPHQKEKFDLIASFTGGGDDCPGLSVPIGSYTKAAPFIDTRDTTGANNTVNSYTDFTYISCCGTQDLKGPDLVYTFTLTARGSAPEIRITPLSAAYDPAVYITTGHYAGGGLFTDPVPNFVLGCPSGAQNDLDYMRTAIWAITNNAGPGGAEVIGAEQINALPLNTRLFLFVDAVEPNNSGPYKLRMQDVSVTSGSSQFDFDGDLRAEESVFRPSDGYWFRSAVGENLTGIPFGFASDRLVPADYDGDEKTDIAIYRDGVWWWIASSNNTVHAFPFGISTDIPVPTDYTGDGRAELAVFRDGIWYTYDLAGNKVAGYLWGLPTDKPVPGDYDGDGVSDYAVVRDGNWYINGSTQGFIARQWGLPTDKLVPADYDGDGKVDPAIYRDGDWWVLRSRSGIGSIRFGTATDIPVPADYDGDGNADFAYFRSGVWKLTFSSTPRSFWSPEDRYFGLPADKPIPSVYVR